MGFEKRELAKKYVRQEGDTLETIAERETAAGNELTARDLARFNFGADDPDTVNECLRDELGCRKRDPDNDFAMAVDDVGRGELLIPQRFTRNGLSVDKVHTLRVKKKDCPPQFLECLCIPGITFEFDKSFVRPAVVDQIKMLAAAAGRHPDAKVMIFGHTDKVGPEQYNKALSERRAKSVYAFIVNDVDTWEQLYNQERWGMRVIQQILQDFGPPYDPGRTDGVKDARTTAAIERYQADRGLAVDGDAGPETRRQMFTEYMTGRHDVMLAPEKFMEPRHMGCGEFSPVDDVEGEHEPNRRVMFYLFHKDRLPELPCKHRSLVPCKRQMVELAPRHKPTFRCSFYDSIAHKCSHEHKPGYLQALEIIEFFGLPTEHDDRIEQPHNLVIPAGSGIVLHWSVIGADRIEIQATSTNDGATHKLPLPDNGRLANPGAINRGEVAVTPVEDTWYKLSAFNRSAETVDHQTVMVTLYRSGGPNEQLTIRATGDHMALVPVTSGNEPPDVVMHADEDDVGDADILPVSSLPLGVPHAKDLMWFLPAYFKLEDLVAEPDPYADPPDPPDYSGLRAVIAAIVKSFNGFGVGEIKTDDRPPDGRPQAYGDILFAFAGDKSFNSTYAKARDKPKTGGHHSSCGLVVRALWLLLGARHDLVNPPYKPESVMTFLRAFAIISGAFTGMTGGVLATARDKGGLGPNEGKGITVPRLTWENFNPQVGDVIFINNIDEKSDYYGSQHVLAVTEIDTPKSDKSITLISCDGGQAGATTPDLPYKSAGKEVLDDGACNGICLRKRRFSNSGKKILAVGDLTDREVTGLVDISKMSFVDPITMPFRNIGRRNLPEPPPVG